MKLKKYIAAVFLGLLVFSPLKSYPQEVAIILGEDYQAYSDTFNSFKKSGHVAISDYYMHSSAEFNDQIIYRLKKQNPKIIVALGVRALSLVKDNFPGVPLVYSLVLNSKDYASGDNACGVKIIPPAVKQLEFLYKIAPSAKKIGVIYSPDNSQDFINEAYEAARNYGSEFVTVKVRDRAETAKALVNFENYYSNIDAFWFIADPVMLDNLIFERLLLFTLNNKIALMAPSANFIERGGLFCMSVDYNALGRQLNGIVAELLSGNTPNQIGLQQANKFSVTFNRKIADKIGIKIPYLLAKEINEIH